MADYLRIGRMYFVLLAIFSVARFAQGAMGMFTTYLALTVIEAGQSYWIGLVVALVAGLVLGAPIGRLCGYKPTYDGKGKEQVALAI